MTDRQTDRQTDFQLVEGDRVKMIIVVEWSIVGVKGKVSLLEDK